MQSTPKKYKRLEISALVNGPMQGPLNAKVFNRDAIKAWSNAKGSGEVFSLLVADTTSEIRVTVFGRSVQDAWTTCELHSSVQFSAGNVKPADPRYNTSNNPFEVIINLDKGGSIVVSDTEIDGNVQYRFKKIKDLADVDPNGHVDVIGIITSKESPQEVRTNRGQTDKATLQLADDSGVSIMCTFWGERAQYVSHWQVGETLALKAAKTSDFSGLSLNCSAGVLATYQPMIQESDSLACWNKDRSELEVPLVSASQTLPRRSSTAGEIVLNLPAYIGVSHIRVRMGRSEIVFVPEMESMANNSV